MASPSSIHFPRTPGCVLAKAHKDKTHKDKAYVTLCATVMWCVFACFSLSCDGCAPTSSACTSLCASGFICDASKKSCVSDKLEPWTAILPGRGARIAIMSQQVFVATRDPRDGALIVGTYTRLGPKDMRILSRQAKHLSTTIALDILDKQRIAIAWVGTDNTFQVATRQNSSSPWVVQSVLIDAQNAPGYMPSDDFDMKWSADGGLHLVFRHDFTNTLMHLYQEYETNIWTLNTIDDGHLLGVAECPRTIRDTRRLGLGQEPELLSSSKGLIVAYHDADCGDLRLARRSSGAWLVTIVDGRNDRQNPRSNTTGRHPSLAEDRTGNIAITYQDTTRARLMFAMSVGGSSFEREVVDRGEILAKTSQRKKKLVGAFSTVSFDERDRPIITYFDASDGDLLRAKRSNTSKQWDITAILEEGLVGFFAHHVYKTGMGLLIGAERLVPTAQGMQSTFVFVQEEVAP